MDIADLSSLFIFASVGSEGVFGGAVGITLILLLLILTAFFVATEFAIVKVRPSRIEQLINEGDNNALAAKKVISNLDEYLSACQLGITITALGLGWLGEPVVEGLLHPVFSQFQMPEAVTTVLSFGIAFVAVTFLHVVLGELAPKTIAIQKAERVTLLFAKPIIFFYRIMYPFIWLLNGSAQSFLRLFGMKPAKEHGEAHTEEELQILLDDSLRSGEINATEYHYVKSIFEFDERTAKDAMIPRRDMVVVDIDTPIEKVHRTILDEKYSRYPVISKDKDSVLGFLNSKDLVHDYVKNKGNIDYCDIRSFVRPLVFVHEAMALNDVLVQMKLKSAQMAIVMDDFGGTSGLITVEDIMEEIVGDIKDEYDYDEVSDVRQLSANETVMSGKVLLEDVNEMFGLKLDTEDIDTLGGWILKQDIQIKEGQKFDFETIEMIVKQIDRRYIKSVLIRKKEDTVVVQ